jgi:hypothetical protein
MTIYFWFSVCLNVGLLVTFVMYRQQVKTLQKRLTVSYFIETQEDKGFLKSSFTCLHKAQLHIDGIPVGTAFTISEEKTSEVDNDRINTMLEEFAKPLLEIGIASVKRLPKK